LRQSYGVQIDDAEKLESVLQAPIFFSALSVIADMQITGRPRAAGKFFFINEWQSARRETAR